MKNLLLLFACILMSCGKSSVEKPDNLIPEEQMIEIYYDLALLEAIKTQRPLMLQQANIEPTVYIYKKYKIDSIQFAQSNRYYSSDMEEYKQMHQEVARRIEENKKQLDAELRKNGGIPSASDAPRVE